MIRRFLIGAAAAIALASCAPAEEPSFYKEGSAPIFFSLETNTKLAPCGESAFTIYSPYRELVQYLLDGRLSPQEFVKEWATLRPGDVEKAYCIAEQLSPGA